MPSSELDQLRILAETAAHLRQAPESRWAKRRRDESIGWAAGSHSLQSIAATAGIPVEAVTEILRDQLPPTEASADESSERHWAKSPLPARFRTVR